jgi:3-oxoacyl-[acyl-carrier-protein] synthase II
MLKERVYIVDYDVVSPIGIGKDNIIESIRANRDAESEIQRVNASGLPFTRAAEIKENLSSLIDLEEDIYRKICPYDRKFELLVACYGLMRERSAEFRKKLDKGNTGVILGIGADVAPFELFEKEIIKFLNEDKNPIVELYLSLNDNGAKLNLMNNPYDLYSMYLADKFKAGAFQKTVLTACVSSTQAIAFGVDHIKSGEAEVVITGGTDSIVNTLAMISFGKLGVIPETEEGKSCKPFDSNRRGTLSGECAGIVVLASEKYVKENNLEPMAEVMGYGNTLDAYKITAPDPEGNSMVRAIEKAVSSAKIRVEDIDYINAHGTGTRHNDLLELKSLERALGSQVKNIPISSTKDRHGHAIAAAGVQEICVLLELMKHELIPKNLNLKTPCDDSFNLVKENYTSRINVAISNNFAFGGINTVLIVKNERD